MYATPILFLIFNRPDTAMRVFAEIRKQQPAHLYIAADGPRPGKGDAERALCEETRARVLDAVDWACDVHTLFRDENIGCGPAVAGAVTWFFSQVEQGIVLEDDCLPDPSFFPFCEEMLTRYRDDMRVMHITGDNYQEDMGDYPYSYYFSVYSHIWGWAAWRRTWERFDYEMAAWGDIRGSRKAVKELMSGVYTASSRKYRAAQFDKMVYEDSGDVWDYRYVFSLWRARGLTVIPAVNLVRNIGAGEEATHLKKMSQIKSRAATPIAFPLAHPPRVAVCKKYDLHVEKRDYQYRNYRKIIKKIFMAFRSGGIKGAFHTIAGAAGRLLRKGRGPR